MPEDGLVTPVNEPTLINRLRDDLVAADFSVSALSSLWGESADAALHRGARVPALRALASHRSAEHGGNGARARAATLAELFILGQPVDADRVGLAFRRLTTAGAVDVGLLAPDGAQMRPLLDLRPYSFVDASGAGSWWIASDLGELVLGRALDEDHVLGVGGATMTLAGLMMQNPVASVLDLGTGCGIQAMHASRHAERVVATDTSQRALDIAAFNAALNGIHTIEFRRGSLFDPVAGELFDQVVTNPPFVITPRVDGVPAYEYRDGGMVGDGIVEAVVRGASRHLTPGGVAQMLGNWEYHTGEHGLDRVRSWIGPLDAWAVEREVQDPAEYAETWIRDGGTRSGTPEFDHLYNAWLDDFAARDVQQVGFGYLTLRMPSAGSQELRRFERVGSIPGVRGVHPDSGLGGHIGACLAAHDRQASLTDEQLAAQRLVTAADVTEERHYWPGAEDPTAMSLRQGSGFGRSVPLDTALAALVGACDGELALGAILGALAELLAVDEAALRADLLPRVRELIDDGFLLIPA
ncbi:methyltransferase [Okibacterium endophyticum]